MPVKNYEKIIPVAAIQFEGNNVEHTDEIFAFVGVPISINILVGNAVELRVNIDPLNPLAVLVGDYIVKDSKGLKHMKQDDFENQYTLVK